MKNIYDNADLMHLKEQEIMGQNRHQFIYGQATDERTSFLEGLEYAYPIIDHNYRPMAIYMMDYSLPNVDRDIESVTRMKLILISEKFLNLSIVYNISNRIAFNRSLNFNTYAFNSSSYSNLISNTEINNITNFLQFSQKIKNIMDLYSCFYKGILNDSFNVNTPIDLPFIDAVEFVSDIKDLLGNKAYFSLIFDNKEDISEISTIAINNFIDKRINKDISIKVATEPGKWKTVYDLDGNMIEDIHDYGEVELDNNKRVYMKKYNRIKKVDLE